MALVPCRAKLSAKHHKSTEFSLTLRRSGLTSWPSSRPSLGLTVRTVIRCRTVLRLLPMLPLSGCTHSWLTRRLAENGDMLGVPLGPGILFLGRLQLGAERLGHERTEGG
jgi:hypothetical protein